MNLKNKYIELIAKVNPSENWKKIRLILHWATIPLKLLLIGFLGIFGILYNRLRYRKRPAEPKNFDKENRLRKILKFLPVLKNENFDLYLPRQPVTAGAFNGADHCTDHQLLRQGQYVFLMSKLNKRTPQMENALVNFIQGVHLLRGYKWDYKDSKFVNNMQSTSGDMLLGLCLAMLDTTLGNEDQSMLLEKFDQLVCGIVDNDYALLEGEKPKEEPYITLYENNPKIKSSRGMWQPGLETVGAQALTLLAALKTNAKKNKSVSSEKEYWDVFYKKGYALLSLLPTAYLPNKRGYFNDLNCIHALYILLTLSETKVEKFVYRFALRYVFNLSKSWYNPYFTGLINEVAPDLISKKYLSKVKEYLYEEEPLVWTLDNPATVISNKVPVPLGFLSHSEFAFGDRLDKIAVQNTGVKVFTGLSELAAMVLLDPEVKPR